MPAQYDSAFAAMDATVLAAFAESCTFLPKNGDAATVSAAVDENSRIEEGENGLTLVAELDVLVSRADISAPKASDGLRREGAEADDVFSYVGILADKGPGGWLLRFEQRRPYEKGGNRHR